jgi:hypothetical protein
MRRAEVKLIAGSIQVDRWTELDDGQLTSMFGCPSANVGTVLPLTSASAPNPKGKGMAGTGKAVEDDRAAVQWEPFVAPRSPCQLILNS